MGEAPGAPRPAGLKEALAPAVRFAREGFRLCKTSALWFGVAEEVLRLTDETRKHFYKGERVYLEGEEVRFPELADTLEAVGEGGVGIFYEGELARRISAYMLEMGGIITEEDLAEYEAVVREPMSVRYGAGAMYTNGPPSAGGPTLAQMLKVVSAYDLATMPEAEYVRVMAGAMKLALRDRETAYLDGSENSRVAERLTGEEYAAEQRRRIFSAFGSPHTTHLSCVDSEGLAVSITASMGYGSGLVVPGTGIPMNNTLGEPELNPRGFHALAPGERLISNMSPTVVSSEEGGVIALGYAGRFAHTYGHTTDGHKRSGFRDGAGGRCPRPALPRGGGSLRLRGRRPHSGPRRLRACAELRDTQHVLRRGQRRQANTGRTLRGGGRSPTFGRDCHCLRTGAGRWVSSVCPWISARTEGAWIWDRAPSVTPASKHASRTSGTALPTSGTQECPSPRPSLREKRSSTWPP